MTRTYYHYAPVQLAPDSIIQPGNYGRMIRRYLHDGQAPAAWKLAVELIFESERKALNPALPGRLDSCFVFEDLHGAKTSAGELNGHFAVLYEVELVDQQAITHRGDFALVTACYRSEPQRIFWDKVHDAARTYWIGAAPCRPEILTHSPIRIKARLT